MLTLACKAALHDCAMALQGLAQWFVCKADVHLMDVDEPDKARKLAKLVGAFLHLGDGSAMDSLDT